METVSINRHVSGNQKRFRGALRMIETELLARQIEAMIFKATARWQSDVVHAASTEGDSNVICKAVVVDSKGRVLILKDASSDFHDLPGGHIKTGETMMDGLAREVKEETGLTIFNIEEMPEQMVKVGDKTIHFFKADIGDSIPSKASARWDWMNESNVFAGDTAGHEFHGNQWTQPGERMSGGDITRKLKNEYGLDKPAQQALFDQEKIPKGATISHKHEDVEKIRNAAEKAKNDPSFEQKRRESLMNTQASNEMLRQGHFGKSYGLENATPRQSVGGVYAMGGYVHEARPSELFKKEWADKPSELRSRGFHMGSDDGGELMRHIATVSQVNDWKAGVK